MSGSTRLTLILLAGLAGRASLPTVNHCDDVSYVRSGNKVHIEADCRIPMDDGRTKMSPADLMSAIIAALMFI